MSTLEHETKLLRELLDEGGLVPPTWDLLFVEIPPGAALDPRGRIRVRRTDFQTAAQFEPRFAELVSAGYPWLNVSCYGTIDGAMIVAIECPLPGPVALVPGRRPSINHSGPTILVVEAGWRADAMLAVE